MLKYYYAINLTVFSKLKLNKTFKKKELKCVNHKLCYIKNKFYRIGIKNKNIDQSSSSSKAIIKLTYAMSFSIF